MDPGFDRACAPDISACVRGGRLWTVWGVTAISVLVCDAQPLFSDALGLALTHFEGLHILTERPADATAAVEATARIRPDVALIDFWLEGMEAPAVAREILAHSPGTRILHLSWFHGPGQIEQSAAAGAVGFLPKGLSVAQVAEGIQRAYAGENPVFEKEVDDLIMRVEERGRYIQQVGERLATISPRELEVLRLLAVGTSSDEIARRLGIAETTVRTHIHRILTKTGAHSQLEAVALARDQGLIR